MRSTNPPPRGAAIETIIQTIRDVFFLYVIALGLNIIRKNV